MSHATTASTFTPRSPLRDALLNQYNVILLGGAVAFSLALASPLPLYAAMLLEGLWLLLGTQVPALRVALARHRDAVTRVSGALPPTSTRPRHTLGTQSGLAQSSVVAAQLADLARLLLARGHEGGAVLDVKLQAVLAAFQQLCAQQTRAGSALALLRAHDLTQPLGALERSLAETEDAATRMQLRRALSQGQRRAREADALSQELSTLATSLRQFTEGLEQLRPLVEISPEALDQGLDELLSLATPAASPRDGAPRLSATMQVRSTGTYFTEPDPL